jgi:hypothetical protein
MEKFIMIIADIITSTEAGRNNFVPEAGQFLVAEDSEKLYLGDGITVGGMPTIKKAVRMAVGLDEMGLNETMESHYVLSIPEEKQTDDSEGSMFHITGPNNNPIYGSSRVPPASSHVVGDIVFVY